MGGRAQNLVLLEGLQIVDIEITDNGVVALSGLHELSSGGTLGLLSLSISVTLLFFLLRVGDSLSLCGSWLLLDALVGHLLRCGGSLGSGSLGGEGHLVERLHVFTIDKIDGVGVDDSGMIALTLDLEIIGYQADRSAWVGSVGRPEGGAAEATAATTTTTTTVVAAAAATTSVGAISLATSATATSVAAVVAATTAAVAAILMASATTLPVATATALIAASVAAVRLLLEVSTTTHVLLLPGLVLALVGDEITTAGATATHVTALPLLLAVLISSVLTRVLVIV